MFLFLDSVRVQPFFNGPAGASWHIIDCPQRPGGEAACSMVVPGTMVVLKWCGYQREPCEAARSQVSDNAVMRGSPVVAPPNRMTRSPSRPPMLTVASECIERFCGLPSSGARELGSRGAQPFAAIHTQVSPSIPVAPWPPNMIAPSPNAESAEAALHRFPI